MAKAYPRKRFFLEMFTRDISLEDCILDLIDNSIDGLIRTQKIDVASELLTPVESSEKKAKSLPSISVEFSETGFHIDDECGGIERKHALDEVFNFGHSAGDVSGSLGVYGIGLKRAIFKIGNTFEMVSRTAKEGFEVNLNVQAWSQKDDSLDDWRIPLDFVAGSSSPRKAGTTIMISDLRPEVKMRLNDGVLAARLRQLISLTYALFLNRYVRISVNGSPIEPFEIPIGASGEVQPAYDEFVDGDVKVKLFASLAARDAQGAWKFEPAGWYALCNGRVVLAADKTELTGWGVSGFPVFHAGKFRGFVGIALFQSQNALALPWTTTKRGLNRESPVFQNARNRMRGAARPIITFLDSMYKPDAPEEAGAKAIADHVVGTPLSTLASGKASTFSVTLPSKRAPRTVVRIQYDAEKSDIERIKKQLRKPNMSAGTVGKFTFDHYLKTECPE